MPSFLLDNNATPGAAVLLRKNGLSATHVKELEHEASSDYTIVNLALELAAVIVTYDNDFPEMLAHSKASSPSVLLLKEGAPTRPAELARFLSSLDEAVVSALAEGAVVSFDGRRIRIRHLPIG